MKADEKECPDCAEIIKAKARRCKHCGYEFAPAAVPANAPANASPGTSWRRRGRSRAR